jgi:hypothetical protein
MAQVKIKHSRLSRGSSLGMMLLGVLTLLFVSGFVGLCLIAVGLVMYWFYQKGMRNSLVAAKNSAQETHAGAVASKPPPPTTIVKEKEIHVVVRIPCKHCGTLNDQLRTKCESCGAPLR